MIPGLRQRRKAHPLFKATEEVRLLRGKIVEQQIYSTAKDDAYREYVNKEVAWWNSIIRSAGSPLRGETQEAYNERVKKLKSAYSEWEEAKKNKQ